jgi:hypothetical protein
VRVGDLELETLEQLTELAPDDAELTRAVMVYLALGKVRARMKARGK